MRFGWDKEEKKSKSGVEYYTRYDDVNIDSCNRPISLSELQEIIAEEFSDITDLNDIVIYTHSEAEMQIYDRNR